MHPARDLLVVLLAVPQALALLFSAYILGLSYAGLLRAGGGRGSVTEEPPLRFAIVSAAHNEEAVIGNLVNSFNQQRYPRQLYDIYVVADRCTDNTASAAEPYLVDKKCKPLSR